MTVDHFLGSSKTILFLDTHACYWNRAVPDAWLSRCMLNVDVAPVKGCRFGRALCYRGCRLPCTQPRDMHAHAATCIMKNLLPAFMYVVAALK